MSTLKISTHHFLITIVTTSLNNLMYQRSSLSHIGFLLYRYLRIRAGKEWNENAATAFVSVHFAFVAWDGVMEELEEVDELADFKEYFQCTWMRGQYPRAMWNFYNYDGPCTNNCLERWHNRLKRIVKKPHQNIYEIIHVFKKEQVLKDHMTDGDVSIKDSHIKEGTFELTTMHKNH